MTELELNWTLSTPGLLIVAVAAIALLLVLIMRFRVHAFLSLIIVSLLTAVATGIPTAEIMPTLLGGFGGTLASVALLVGHAWPHAGNLRWRGRDDPGADRAVR